MRSFLASRNASSAVRLGETPSSQKGNLTPARTPGMGEHVAHEVHAGVRRGPHPSRKKCKEGCRQPLEIDRGGCQISLDFRVGEAAPDGARKSVPCLGLAVKASIFYSAAMRPSHSSVYFWKVCRLASKSRRILSASRVSRPAALSRIIRPFCSQTIRCASLAKVSEPYE